MIRSTPTVGPDGDPSGHPPPLLVPNLLIDCAALAPLLRRELRRGAWLDAYLLTAGLHQIVADDLHRDPYALTKVARHLAQAPTPLGALAAAGARWAGAAAWCARERRMGARHLLRWHAALGAFAQQLAAVAVSPVDTATGAAAGAELIARGEALLAPVEDFPPRLRRIVLRLPSCFRSFDQQPADLERLVGAFARRWPDRHRPMMVVGLRTSGSYLAPLLAAFLRARGYRDVRVLTMRPGQRWLGHERAGLRAATRAGGLILLTDDPPQRGDALATAAGALRRIGVPRPSIVLLVQLFGPREAMPPTLRPYPAVLLPWEEWAIHERLAPTSVRATLMDLADADTAVGEVERLALPPRVRARGHVRALYRVRLVDRSSGRCAERLVYAKGAGLGYFGAHALAVAGRLRGFVPDVYGVEAGLVYRAWLPDGGRLSAAAVEPGRERAVAHAVAAYVEARHRALALDEDVSLRLVGRHPAWQRAGDLLGRAFGRAAPLARPVLHRTAKRLLRVERPSVVDGGMAPSHWFASGTGGGLLKTDADEHAFSNLDMFCCDPIFDLAGAAAHYAEGTLPRLLRQVYEGLTAVRVDDERWLLYQLLLLQERQRETAGGSAVLAPTLARVYRRYVTDVLFGDLTRPDAGPLCAIDIDGVLETGALGFPAITPAGARALRALARHGYRAVVATGRSLDDVRDRCDAYRLAGGVAEYGAAIYDHGTGHARRLLSASDRARLDGLRAALREIEGVYLDADYREAVRAYRLDRHGERRSLHPETVAAALARCGTGERLRPIGGAAQTDFMVAGVDKGTGLRALGAELGAGGAPVALAVGDTVSDLPLFAMATLACAPANADATVREAGIAVMGRPYQAGLALAVARLLRHRPGGCPTCRAPRLSAEADLLLAALAAQDVGKAGKLWQALLLAAKVGRT